MDLSQLLDTHYYLSTNPGGDFVTGYVLFAFFTLLLFLGKIIRLLTPNSKYLKKSIKGRFGKFIALGIIGLILVASRFSGVPFFAMRLWLYITVLLSIIFLVWTGIAVYKDYKKRIASVEREKGKESK